MEGCQVTSLVLPYFEAIYNKFNNAQLNYNIGIYGSRNVCSQVINAEYTQSAFVDGASQQGIAEICGSQYRNNGHLTK